MSRMSVITGDVRYSSPLESARLPADVALSGIALGCELYGQHGVDEIVLCQRAVHEWLEPIVHAQQREAVARRHDRDGGRLDGAIVGTVGCGGDGTPENHLRL